MQFGLFGSAQAKRGGPNDDSGAGFREFVERNVEAEALGYHSTFLVEHHFTGFGQVSATLNLLTWIGAVRSRARALADQVGLADKADRYPDELSQGERQRIAVCRAVLPQPGLLLADEPTGNLDPANKTRVLDVLFAFARDQGSTLVAVTHDHDLLSHFDRTIDFKDYHLLAESAA